MMFQAPLIDDLSDAPGKAGTCDVRHTAFSHNLRSTTVATRIYTGCLEPESLLTMQEYTSLLSCNSHAA